LRTGSPSGWRLPRKAALWLRPDGKDPGQRVYEGSKPVGIDKLVAPRSTDNIANDDCEPHLVPGRAAGRTRPGLT
jgi:hypothetical protein